MQQRCVRAETVAEPDARHTVAFRERLEDKKPRAAREERLQALAAVRQIKKALVREKVRSELFAERENFFKQRAIGKPSGGVIRVAEEKHLRPRLPQKI